MTQAAYTDITQRLDKLTSIIERVDNHIQELRLETKTFQARAEEQIKATQQQISDLDQSLSKRIDTLEQRSNGQEPRFWRLSSTDTNIDHCRVHNLIKHFERQGKAIAITQRKEDYLAGDVATWNLGAGQEHIGIVTQFKSAQIGHI